MPRLTSVGKIYAGFTAEIDALRGIDIDPVLSEAQLALARDEFTEVDFITESILARAYRAYEAFLENLFIEYCLRRRTLAGTHVRPYVRPRDRDHAGELIQVPARLVEWGSVDTVISLSDAFFLDGFPIKNAITTNRATLVEIRRVRNYIAHSSKTARKKYSSVVTHALRTPPLSLPTSGQFLRTRRTKERKINLDIYLDCMMNVAAEAAQAP